MLENRRYISSKTLQNDKTSRKADTYIRQRRRLPVEVSVSVSSLLASSCREKLKEEVRRIFREASLIPADQEWLADQLCVVAARAAQGEVDRLVRILCKPQEVQLFGLVDQIKLVWQGAWRIEGAPLGREAMIERLVMLFLAEPQELSFR